MCVNVAGRGAAGVGSASQSFTLSVQHIAYHARSVQASIDGFDTRSSVVGNLWYTAIKEDPRLANDYKAIGRGYAAQQDFRRRWAAEKFIVESKKQIIRETSSDFEGMSAEYLTLSALAWEFKSSTAATN
jgi:hypothetical protein